jgi:hypothetical protein
LFHSFPICNETKNNKNYEATQLFAIVNSPASIMSVNLPKFSVCTSYRWGKLERKIQNNELELHKHIFHLSCSVSKQVHAMKR